MYKVHYLFIKSAGEEYQVVKRGRECHGCGEENNVEKGKGEAILRLWGRISSGEEDRNFEKKINILKMGVKGEGKGEAISSSL